MRDDIVIKDMLIKRFSHSVRYWVCDYQRKSGLEKVMRNVKPTYVEITISDYDLKKVFEAKTKYDEYKFNPEVHVIKKDGTLGKIIPYYGTSTWDRGLYFFETEKEAVKQYNDLIFACIESIKIEKENVAIQFDASIETLKECFVQSDYVMELLVRSHGGSK